MTEVGEQDSVVDLDTVQAELAPLIATISWTRAQLEEVKGELAYWIEAMTERRAPNPALTQQHDPDEDALDDAIVAEHERVTGETD